MLDVLLCSANINGLGIKILYNNLKRAGISVETACIPLDVIEKILFFKPKIICINWVHVAPTYEFIIEVLPKIRKKLPDIKFIFGGYNATYDWIHLKDYTYCDYIVGGEADDALVKCCNEILMGNEVDKLKYLTNPEPDLLSYDYDNNFVSTGEALLFETGRSCIFAKNKRCWYCSQFQNTYRKLDLNKITQGIRKNLKNEKSFVIVDPEVMPTTLNDLWNTFKIPMFCFLVPQHYKLVSDDVEGCILQSGYDVYTDYTGLTCNNTKEYLNDILRVAKKNKIILSTVIKDEADVPSLMAEIKRLETLSPNIIWQLNTFEQMPGVDNKPYNINIYEQKVDKRFFGKPSYETKPISVTDFDSYNDYTYIQALEKYKLENKHNLELTNTFTVFGNYSIFNISSFIVDAKYRDKFKNNYYILTIDSIDDKIKCIRMG